MMPCQCWLGMHPGSIASALLTKGPNLMLATRFTELVGCAIPIQQAAMGTLAKPRLAAAVANAGGLGSVSVYGVSPAIVAALLDDAAKSSRGPISANFIDMARNDAAAVREGVAVAAARARVVDFFFSDPDPALIEIAHRNGALACWQVGSVAEARAAADAGCDFIIAQGVEAGGHVRGTIGLLPLLDAVLQAVSVPVLAAGGIGSGRAMAAALAAGADGVRIGTRFVAAEEADAHPGYVQALIAARGEDTVYTQAFSTNWPDAPHRLLRACIDAAKAVSDGEIVGHCDWYGTRAPIYQFDCTTIDRSTTGNIGAMPHWAGQGVGAVQRVQPAAEIVDEIAGEADRLLTRWSMVGRRT
jgi:NAD(P)H-dependent flavin oxidoreductase YrpB (nitropropane dioxygenase family)